MIAQLAGRAASASAWTLAGIAGLHTVWGFGSAFPFKDHTSLANNVSGLDDPPPSPACFAVAAALTSASALVADVLPMPPRFARQA